MAITDETRKIIFNKLKNQFDKICPPMVLDKFTEGKSVTIIGNKPVPYGHKKEIVPGMYFVSVEQRKDSVVFYFFPAYMQEDAFTDHAPNLWKCLKGKTCFHFKKEEQVNEKELQAILKKGIQLWKKLEYLN